MNDTRWRWRLLRCGAFRLDGGSMFGIVPKALWARLAPPDDQNRIPLQTNALLLEREGRLVVVEVGNGDKFGPRERDIYAMENRSILDALHEADCRPEDVSTVIVSHLHFDHAGGLTRAPRPGEAGGPRLTFPNAEIVSQRDEWDDALANRSTMTRTYLKDHLTPEVASRLRLIDGPCPTVPARGQRAERPADGWFPAVEAAPGVEVFRVPGHTWGQQAVRFRDDKGRTVVFTPDVMPTVHHAGPAYNMAYDVEPFVSGVMRTRFLEEAAGGLPGPGGRPTDPWTLALDHEPGQAVVRVERDPDKPGVVRLTPAD